MADENLTSSPDLQSFEAFAEENGETGQDEQAVTTEPEVSEEEVKAEASDDTKSEEADETDVMAKIAKGEKLSEEEMKQVKEWKDSGLRRDDYTRKTQELSDLKKTFQEEYSPEEKPAKVAESKETEEPTNIDALAEKLGEKFLTKDEVSNLVSELRESKFDRKMDELRSRYGDSFAEVSEKAKAIFNKDKSLLRDFSKYELVFEAASASVMSDRAREEGAKTERETTKATADTTRASSGNQGYTKEDIDKMTPAELLQNFPELQG